MTYRYTYMKKGAEIFFQTGALPMRKIESLGGIHDRVAEALFTLMKNAAQELASKNVVITIERQKP